MEIYLDIRTSQSLSSFASSSCAESVALFLSACEWTHVISVLGVCGRLMGLICPTVLCVRQAPRPRRRTWVKEWIIDSDKALWALIAAGELDYLSKLPSLAKGESYQWSPDWPHIVLLWTCSGRGQETDVCLHVRIYLGRIEIAQSLPVTVCLLSHDPPDVSPVELSRVVLFLEITYFIDWW